MYLVAGLSTADRPEDSSLYQLGESEDFYSVSGVMSFLTDTLIKYTNTLAVVNRL